MQGVRRKKGCRSEEGAQGCVEGIQGVVRE